MQRLLLLLALLPAAGFAQADTVPAVNRFQVGVVYGQMDHEVDFTPSRNVEPLRGSEIGVAIRYFDKRLVGFQAELSLVEAGWREDISPAFSVNDTFTSQYERRSRYAELQILTQFSFGNGAVQPMLQAGPYLAVPLSQREAIPDGYDFNAPENPPALPVLYDFDLPFRLNYGLRVGAGLNVEIGPVTVQAEARYLIGFNDIVKTGETVNAVSRRAGIGGRVGVFYALWE